MDTLEVLSVIAQQRRAREPSAETDEGRSSAELRSDSLPPISPETRQLAHELGRRRERPKNLGRYTVETSRVDQDLDPVIYLAFLRNVSNQRRYSSDFTSSHDNLEDVAAQWGVGTESSYAHGGAHDSGQPQDGLSRQFQNEAGSETSPEFVALLRHRPRNKHESLNAKQTPHSREEGSCGKQSDDHPNCAAPESCTQNSRWLIRGICLWLLKVMLLVAVPVFILLQAECREPIVETVSCAWREISPFFQSISPRDLFLHDELLFFDELYIPETPYYEQPVPDETDKNIHIRERFASPVIQEPKANVVAAEEEAVFGEYAVGTAPDDGDKEEEEEEQEEATQHTAELLVDGDGARTVPTDLAAYENIAARPTPLDKALLLARVKRLEALVKHDMDLVTSYHDMHTNRYPVADTLQNFGWKVLLARRFFPATDPDCRWNFLTERCEPACVCSWQYKVGDLWPSRSCRKRPADSNCEDDLKHQGPIRRTFSSMGDRTKVILRKVNNWIPRMPRPILQDNRKHRARIV